MKVKIIKKVLISLLSTVLFVVILYSANHRHCYHFVEKLNYNCKGISDLNNYIDHNMLSSDLKKLISKDKFSFSNAEEKYKFCSLVSSLDYEYEGNPNSVYSTNQIGRNDLAQRITIENKEYIISVTIVFKPGWFFTPKIVDLDASVFDIDNPDWKG